MSYGPLSKGDIAVIEEEVAHGNSLSEAYRILEGDSTEILACVPAGSAGLVVADPPYNLGVDYGHGAAADRRPVAWICQ